MLFGCDTKTSLLLSIFGALSITRYVYGTREGQRIACVPLDAQLGLPEGAFSYGQLGTAIGDIQETFANQGLLLTGRPISALPTSRPVRAVRSRADC